MGNDDQQSQQGNLTYWAASQAVLAIASPLAVVYVCHLILNGRDGSILVQFPTVMPLCRLVENLEQDDAA